MSKQSKRVTLATADRLSPNVSDAALKQKLRDGGQVDAAEPPKRTQSGGDWESKDVYITAARRKR